MFFAKAPSDARWQPTGAPAPSLRLEVSIPLLRPHEEPDVHDPKWLDELAEVVDSLPDLVASFDRDGRLLLINAAGIDVLGHPPHTLAGLLISNLYPERDAERIVNEALQEAIQHGRWSGCAPLADSHGAIVETYQRWTAHRLEDNKARAFTLVARRLDDSSDTPELRNRRENVTAMSLGIVHDLNNLLGPITSYADLAASVSGAETPAARYIEQIVRASRRARALTGRLGEMAREQEPRKSRVDMADATREIVGWIRVARPDLEIALLVDENVSTTVSGNPAQLHQVVLNLVRNASDALSDRSGSIRIHLGHTRLPRSEGTYLKLTVDDNGRGIDEHSRSRMFEPFFSTRKDGSGLGLHVARELVHIHGGEIRIEPGEHAGGGGTRATIYLPLSDDTGVETAR